MFDFVSDTSKRVLKTLFILCLAAFAAGFLFVPRYGHIVMAKNMPSYALGIVIGYVLCTARFLLLERALNKSMDMEKESASSYVRLQYMMRYFLAVVILIVVAVTDVASLLGAILPLLLLQPAVYIVGLKEKKKMEK